uniref:Uncharacterized protein n=1 Tax=Kalanchoe fedtschenkoi TaxID=63787 RepID=A0A7N0U8H7_KALFE
MAAAIPLQRFIETLQNLCRSQWMERLRRHEPARAFVEDFLRATARLLAYIRRHRLLPDPMRRPQPPAVSARESVHVRRVHREHLFTMLFRLHRHIDTLRRIARQAPPQQAQHHHSSDDHRRLIDVLHAFTNFHADCDATTRR